MYIFESNCKVYSYGTCYYNTFGVKIKGFMIHQYIKGKDGNLGLGFEGGVKEMSRLIKVFNIFQKTTENRIHLKVDKAMEGCTGK